MSLLGRARKALEDLQASEDGYSQMHRARNRDEVVRWVASALECQEEELEGLEAVAGAGESFLWRFKIDGLNFLAGTAWCKHPGPPGRNLFLALLRSPIRGAYSWPPDVDHDNQIEIPGTTRIHNLADLAEAVDEAA